MQTPDLIDGYRVLGMLGRGGAGRVYQVEDPDGRPRALKVLETGGLTAADERRFAQEFKVNSTLVHPNIVQVFGAGTAEGVPYFTMEFIPGGHLRDYYVSQGGMGARWVVQPELKEQFFRIVSGVLSGLACIHAQRIVHRDLKPENILLAPDGTPKIMDFGLARCLESSVRLTTAHTILGTVAYMSPEQVASVEVDPRSDLYSLGIILYEWLNGGLPYSTTDLGHVITQIMTSTPPPLHLINHEIPMGISVFISALLAKDPNARPPTADAAITAWQAACQGLTPGAKVPRPAPVQPVLAFFEPTFVGRESEMERLQNRLDSLEEGRSSLIFIGGESGVGKSRLGLELARMASLRGMQTLNGRSFEDVDVPFEAFQPVLRSVLKTEGNAELTDFIELARPILARVLPELRSLKAPEEGVDKFRLLETLAQCLELKACPKGVVILLDDVQWADSESLGVLAFLSRTLMFAPYGERRTDFGGIMLIAMYRKEEMTPDHPLLRLMTTLKPHGQVEQLSLNRLGPADVERLVKSMLGGRAVPEGLLDLLTRECEGNAFFVGEFLKAMLEESVLSLQGGEWSLKSQAFRWSSESGLAVPLTIRDVLRRRLQTLSLEAGDLLRLCSVIGREVPYPLLQQAWTRPEEELLEAAEQLIVNHLLVELPRRDSVAFYHAQIREVVLEDMPHLRRRALHRKVGEAIERWSGSAPDAHLFELAHHFTEAQVPSRAVPYLMKAADQAFNAHAYAKAQHSLEQVFAWGNSGAIEASELIRAEEKRAQCLLLSGEYRQAREVYADLEKRTTGPDRAAILRRMGRACEALGEHDKALESYHAGLAAVGEKLQIRPWKSLMEAVSHFRQIRKSKRKPPEGDEARRLTELRRLYDQMIQTYYFATVEDREAQGLELALRHLQTSLTLGHAPDIAQAYMTAAFILHHVGTRTVSATTYVPEEWQTQTREESRAYLDKALQLGDQLPESPLKARIMREVGYCLLVEGQIQRAIALLEASTAIARRLNDVLGLMPATAMLALALWIKGDMARTVEVVQVSLARARSTENATFVVLSLLRLARVAIVENRLEEAQALTEQSAAASFPSWGPATLPVLILEYVRGLCLACLGDFQQALPRLDKSRQGFREAGISLYDRTQVNFDTAMAWLDSVEAGADPGPGLAAAADVVEETRAIADVSYLKAQALIIEGRLRSLRHEPAASCFDEAVALLRPIDCPRLLAIALIEGGHALQNDDWLVEGRTLAEQHGYGLLLQRASVRCGGL